MYSEALIELSRWQFAITALYHFIFVPLTLGISWMIFIMEVIYVRTGNTLYRDMTKFWGKLFGINFAIGVATGITMEFQFGTNWSNYSHYVGDIFGAPLAIEGLLAFFLESTFIGLFFTGWNRFSKVGHLVVTFLTALGSNLSAMWILIANGWMQYPEFSQFVPERMRMEMTDFWGLITSPVAQVKFLHTVCAGYITAAVFIMGVSAWFMLKKRHILLAQRSMLLSIVFALCGLGGSALSGDLSALQITEHQPAKLAAMEAEFETQEPPAAWSVIALPNQHRMENLFSIQIPGLLGLIATHSFDTPVMGLKDIVSDNKLRVEFGGKALAALNNMRAGKATEEDEADFETYKGDLGYGLLLSHYAKDINNPTEEEISKAAQESIPPVFLSFLSFRAMLALAGLMGLIVLAGAFFLIYKKDLHNRPLVLWAMVAAIPLPFLSCEFGWLLAEMGRQPWAIQDILPTALAVSDLSSADVALSVLCFVGIYTVFFIIEMALMVKAVKKGPSISDAAAHEGVSYAV